MKLLKNVLLVMILIAGLTVSSFANGLNLNGMGTKAISMGGAFIGLANDYSAVFWNPAGLTQLEDSNFSLFSSFIIPKGTYEYAPAGINIETESAVYPAPALSFYKPISENLVVGIAAYATAGSGAEWDGSKLAAFNPMYMLGDTTAYTWKSMVGAMTVSPVAALKIGDSLSVGFSLNIVYGFLQMERPALGQYKEDLKGMGVGATIGFLYKASDSISIGLTYKTPQKIKLTGTSEMSGLAAMGMSVDTTATREVTWPMWIGGGVAIKPMDKLTITFDVQYTNWKKLDTISIEFDEAFWKMNLGNGSLEEGSAFELYWNDATQIRAGLEYVISDSLALRAGYYYDPAPAPATTLNIMLPSITYNVVTVGFGYKTDKINLDLGLEYLKGANREADYSLGMAMPGTHGMDMIVPTVSFTYTFN